MRHLSPLVLLLVLITLTAKSQETKKDQTPALVSRGTLFTGLSSDLAFGVSIPGGDYVMPAIFRPKFGYFLFDRFSVQLSVQAVGLGSRIPPRLILFHNTEVELNYYFYAKKNFLLYSKTGIAVEQYSPRGYRQQNRSTTSLKLGVGMSWRLKKLPCLGLNADAAYYIGPYSGSYIQKVPEVTFGVSYFFNSKKKASKKQATN